MRKLLLGCPLLAVLLLLYAPPDYAQVQGGGSGCIIGTPTTGHIATFASATCLQDGGNPVGTGTVTSVGLALPSIFTISGSPITASGTLTGALATQSANLIFAGPGTGVAATPTFRALVAADIPALPFTDLTGQATLAQLPGIANDTILGNVSGSTGVPSALSQIQLTALCNVFSATLSGCAPASGGGTSNFLRADGTWAAPSGSGTVNSGTAGQLGYYAATGTAISGSADATISGSALTLGVAGSAQGSLLLSGATSGTETLAVPAAASGTIKFPAGSIDFTATGGAHQVVEQTTLGGTFTVGQLGFADIANQATLTQLPSISANTLLGNATSSTATPTAIAVPACVDTGGNHLNWTAATGFSCGTTSSGGGGGTVPTITEYTTAAASYTFGTTNLETVAFNQATTFVATINLPASPAANLVKCVNDEGNNFFTHNATVKTTDSTTINQTAGTTGFLMNQAHENVCFAYNSATTNWLVE